MADETVTVVGQTQENAEKLLSAVEDLGLDYSVVRTVEEGFTAPASVVDKAFGAGKGPRKPEPDEASEELYFSTKAAAEAYADEHQLDVDKSLKADDYKAAVVAASKGGE